MKWVLMQNTKSGLNQHCKDALIRLVVNFGLKMASEAILGYQFLEITSLGRGGCPQTPLATAINTSYYLIIGVTLGTIAPPPPTFFSHRSRHGHVFNNYQLASQTSIDRSICVPSCNFWTKDTWFGPELVFSHVWLVVYSKDLLPVHCIHTFEGCAGGITLNFFVCTYCNYSPPTVNQLPMPMSILLCAACVVVMCLSPPMHTNSISKGQSLIVA